MRTRLTRLLVSCVVLGAGVGLLLLAALGSDGYSTLVNGTSIAFGVPFLIVNCVVGVVLVLMAWLRGLRPGLGTIVQPVVVGAAVSVVLATVDEPDGLLVRTILLVVAFPVLALGVAGYLGSGWLRPRVRPHVLRAAVLVLSGLSALVLLVVALVR